MATSQTGASKKQLNLSNQYGAGAAGNQNQLYGQLGPMLTGEATNPQGFGQKDLNAMLTASNQALGGATGAAAGQGALNAARTRNSAGLNSAVDKSAQEAGEAQSQNALNVQNQNAMLKQKQQQAGISGLQGLYGTNTQELESMLGLGPSTLQAGKQPSGFQTAFGDILQAGQAGAKAAAGF